LSQVRPAGLNKRAGSWISRGRGCCRVW
jgi:hypothetical protein